MDTEVAYVGDIGLAPSEENADAQRGQKGLTMLASLKAYTLMGLCMCPLGESLGRKQSLTHGLIQDALMFLRVKSQSLSP